MRRPPTDWEILSAIYDRHYRVFASYSKQQPDRAAKIFVPVDIERIAADLGVDPDIVFGRLYYHLNKRYSYHHDDDTRVEFFALKVGTDTNCINFPYMASVLAELADRRERFRIATTIAIISLVIALASFFVSVLR